MPLEMQGRSSDGYAMHWLSLGLYHALAMLWATFWALVLGFTISGVLQVFVGKEQISRAFGQTNLKSVSFATGLGAASSSCSYAAVAAARSAMQQGAALIPALAFMFASTNLVIELGAVLWVLMGWQFVFAEVLGALLLIMLMWLLIRLFYLKLLKRKFDSELRIKRTKTDIATTNTRLRPCPAWRASMSMSSPRRARPVANTRKGNGRASRTPLSWIGRCFGKKFSAAF